MPAETFSLTIIVFLNREIALIFIKNGKSSIGQTILELSRPTHVTTAILISEKTESQFFAILSLSMKVNLYIVKLFEASGNSKSALDDWDPLACKPLHRELI